MLVHPIGNAYYSYLWKKQVNITQSSSELDTTIFGLKCWNKSNIIGKVIQVNKKKKWINMNSIVREL